MRSRPFYKLTLLVITLLLIGVIVVSWVSINDSDKCISYSKEKCPDGMNSYKHESNLFSPDICECECFNSH